MNQDELLLKAAHFRAAIEAARDAGEFIPQKSYLREPMDN